MLIVAIRTLITYFAVLFAIRIMGKSELSKMSPFQMVIAFMIAELAAIPIDSPDASLINGVIAICSLTFLQVFISFLTTKSEGFKVFISGRPTMIVENGRLNVKEMARQRMTTTDLLEQLRIENCPSISDVEYAVLESNGQLSIIQKAASRPLTPKDVGLDLSESALPLILISDGNVYEANLAPAGLDESALLDELSRAGATSPRDVFLAFYDGEKKLHVYLAAGGGQPFAREVTL